MSHWDLLKYEEEKLKQFNNYVLNDAYNRKKGESQHHFVKEKEENYYIFQVVLLQYIPTKNAPLLKIPEDWNISSPQEFLLSIIKNETTKVNNDMVKKILNHVNALHELGNFVTLHGMKNVWINEKDLVKNQMLKLYARLTLKEMSYMLKTCPYPNICFKKCNVRNPNHFVRIINKCKDITVFNFTPYIRHKHQYLQSHCVYRLDQKIELVDKRCFTGEEEEKEGEEEEDDDDDDDDNDNKEKINKDKIKELYNVYLNSLDNTDWNLLLNPRKMVTSNIVSLYLQYLLLSNNNNIHDISVWPHEVYQKELPPDWKISEEEKKDWILIPICLYKHYVLVVFSLRKKIVYILDSMSNDKYFEELKNFTKRLLQRDMGGDITEDWMWIWLPNHEIKIPTQRKDSVDCGIFVMIYAKQIIVHKNLNFEPVVNYDAEEITQLRMDIYNELKKYILSRSS